MNLDSGTPQVNTARGKRTRLHFKELWTFSQLSRNLIILLMMTGEDFGFLARPNLLGD